MTDSCESCNAKELAGTPVVQPKLVVGPVNDPYEQEADRVADHVMRMPDTEVATTSETDPGPVVQRVCTDCDEEEKMQRQPEDEEEEEQSIQAKREGGPTGGEVSAKQTAEIESIKTGGESLRPASRNFFEERFGHDFSRVRIHSDDRAAQSAKGIHAQAYTTGQHIVFGAGHYSPDTHTGQRLLAHELSHVIQQSGGQQIRRKQEPQSKQQSQPKSGAIVFPERELQPGLLIEGPSASPAGGGGDPIPPPDEASVSQLPASGNRIQRSAKFVKGIPDPVINPAEQISENKIPDAELYFGRTNFLLNGKSFTSATDAEMNAALKKPGIAYGNTTITVGDTSQGSGSGSGSGAKPKTIPGFECWFDSVRDNEGTNEVKVLKPGSWTHVTEKKNVAGRFSSLKACKKGAGDVTFVLRGDPDADTVRDKVKAHENKHAEDNEAIFNNLVVAWDKDITTTFNNKSKAKAPTKKICEHAVYTSGGKNNNPEDLITNLSQQINAAGLDFHSKPAGARPKTKPEKPDSDCNVVKARTGY